MSQVDTEQAALDEATGAAPAAGHEAAVHPPSPAAEPQAGQASALPAFVKPDKPTIGEKFWKQLTYTVGGYGAVVVVSIGLWDFFYSGRGKPVYTGIQKGATAALKALGLKPQQAESLGGSAAKYVFSPLGGHVLMPPIKFLEDHGRYITHKANQMLDGSYAYKDLEASWNTPDEELPPMADEPNKNTWGQIAMRRGMGWAAVIASGMGLRAAKIETPLEEGAVRLLRKGAELTGSGGLQRMAQTDQFERYARLSALEATLTVVTAAITAMTKQTFGKSREASDDALSIDVPGLTENGNGNGHAVAAAPVPAATLASPVPPARTDTPSFAQQHASRQRNHLQKHDSYKELVATDTPAGIGLETHS